MRVCLLGMTFAFELCDCCDDCDCCDGGSNIQNQTFCIFFSLCTLTEQKLLSWLQKQKEQGYMIVGVEQTLSSISLDHKFTKRTVLLLGKEKEGIPVEFLQAVDVCIEIPQLGVIWSLNVHVTGVLAIWEYTKQMMDQCSA